MISFPIGVAAFVGENFPPAGPVGGATLRSAGSSLTYNPAIDAGNTDLYISGSVGGTVFVTVESPDITIEEMVLREEALSPGFVAYPATAPRMPQASSPTVLATEADSPVSARSTFLSGAWSRLQLGQDDQATFARARVRRCHVTNVQSLAGAMTEATPASRKIVRVLGKNATGNTVEGWVYVETGFTQGSNLERHLHQLVPAGMVLPPAGDMTIVSFENVNDWDLAGFLAAKAQVGMYYARCRSWSCLVGGTTAIEQAGLPTALAVPSGATAWT